MTDRLQKLQEVVGKSDKDELVLAFSGWQKAKKSYFDAPGEQTKKNLEAARGYLDDILATLTAKYFPEDAPAPEGERFVNRTQAHNWLKSQGYAVSRSKFYQDCDAGFPQVHKDKSVSRFQVMQYAQQQDVERRGALPSENSDHQERKAKADADMAEMKAEEMRREKDKEWLHSDDAWAAVAGLVGALKDSLTHFVHAGQGEIIHAAGGDPSRGPEVVEVLEEITARAFNEVAAGGKIEGVFEVGE